MTTPSSKSLQRAAQAWCDATTSHKEMDSALATEFARILDADLAAAQEKLAAMKQRAEAAERERDSAVSWNHRVSVCEKHTAEIVDGPCVICKLEAAERKAEEAARDAGRYRWLRGNPCLPFGVTRYRSEPVEYYAGDSLDASIDAAIAAKGGA